MRQRLAVCLCVLMAIAGAARADIDAGRTAYAAKGCLGCHGVDGVSKSAEFPTLKGRDAAFVRQSLTEFRSGARTVR